MKKKQDDLWKWILSLVWDVVDFTVGRIPLFGTIFDVLGLIVAYKLWGKIGLITAWEILDISDQIDSFIPTTTLSGIISKFVMKQ